MGGAIAPEPLRLLHLDKDIVAVDKPPGLLLHPSALDAHETRSALALLRVQLGTPVWTVHRLDKGTSGVLLFARHPHMARMLGAAFEAGAVRKRYIALVRGWPPENGEIDHPLARDPERPSTGQPRVPALTRFERLHRIEWPFADGRHPTSRYAVLGVEPLSGRRHQIRRHLKHIAHPIVGDSTHGKGAHNRAVAAWLGVDRLWLHALRLEIPAVGSRPTTVIEAPADDAWRRALAS
jgi:tRNA pseudouridine65 synthase